VLRDQPTSAMSGAAGAVLLMAELEKIVPGFEKAGVDYVVLKGAALIACGLRNPAERGLTDIDVLVRSSQASAARAVLSGMGFIPMPDSSSAFIKESGSGGELLVPVIADLHHWLDYRSDCGPVFASSRKVRFGSSFLRVPASEEHVLLICAHGILHHACLPPAALEDVRALCCADGFSWDALASVAKEAGAESILSAAFSEFSRRGLSVPASFSDSIRPVGALAVARERFFRAGCGVSPAGVFVEYLLPQVCSPRNITRYWSGGGLLRKPVRAMRNVFRRTLRRKGI